MFIEEEMERVEYAHPLIQDSGLWFNICINGRPSKKLFEKIVEPKIKALEEKLRVACEALEACDRIRDVGDIAREALAKIKAPCVWSKKTTEEIQDALERNDER